MAGWVDGINRFSAYIAHGWLSLLFPPRCAHCLADIEFSISKNDPPICPECRRRLVPEKWIGCRHCGSAIPDELEPSDFCSSCKHPPLLFDTVVVMGGYRDNLLEAVLRMKHPRQEFLSRSMGRLLAQTRLSELSALGADVIVPIPMYWLRRMRRGTNSAELIARELGRKLELPVRRRMLIRARNTLPQVGLSPNKRFHNMKGAFHVGEKHGLDGMKVLLVDDVLTTGATASEAAKVLKKAGAAAVSVAVIARAP